MIKISKLNLLKRAAVCALFGGLSLAVFGCDKAQKEQETTSRYVEDTTSEEADWSEEDKETLRYVFEQDFGGEAGVCLPEAAFSNSARMDIVFRNFNNVTMENEMKPETFLGAEPNIGEDGYPVLNFSKADAMLEKLVEYNSSCDKTEKKIRVRGHVLVWHSQTPEWFFHEDYDVNKPYVTADVMQGRMDNYICQVMEHYYGENSRYGDIIYAWDVVNEAVNDTDGMIRTDSSWFNVYKDDSFIINAFVCANKYAPSDVKLFYNDYNDTNATKADGICRLLDKIKQEPEARIDGMGMQGHHDMNFSVYDFEDAVRKYAQVVEEIQITELDIKSSTDYTGKDVEAEYQKQAYVYKDLYDSVKKLVNEENINISSIVFWGTDDGNSWLQSSNSVGGSADGSRPQCPLLFDASYSAKPAFWAFVNPDILPPKIQDAVAGGGKDFDTVQNITFEAENLKVFFSPLWSAEGLSVNVTVIDESEDDNDSITIFADAADSRKSGADIIAVTVKRSEADSNSNNRYEAVVNIPIEGLTASQVMGFDIRIMNGDTAVSWNDTKNIQDSSSENYGRLVLKPYVEIGYGNAQIDGVYESKWDSAECLPLSIVTAESALPEASASGRVMWDEEALYVWFEVLDPNMDVTGGEVHLQDSVEIFIDEKNNKASSYDDNDKQYRINCENKLSFNGPSCVADNIVAVVNKTDTGYVVECAIKWTAIEPSVGSNIGFELQVNDCKGGTRLGMLNWFDTTNTCWSSPSSYGNAKLVEAKE